MTVRIKRRARADLLAVRAWGETHWGLQKSREFLEGLIERIEELQDFPMMGRARPSLHPELRSIRYNGYVLFYALEEGAPVIVAVLHERQNHAALDFADRLDGV